MSKFNIRKFLTENKLTEQSQLLSESLTDDIYRKLRLGSKYVVMEQSGVSGTVIEIVTERDYESNDAISDGTPLFDLNVKYVTVYDEPANSDKSEVALMKGDKELKTEQVDSVNDAIDIIKKYVKKL